MLITVVFSQRMLPPIDLSRKSGKERNEVVLAWGEEVDKKDTHNRPPDPIVGVVKGITFPFKEVCEEGP